MGIYANPEYYFQYDNPDFQALMEELNATTDPATRSEMLARAQTIISEDYVNGYLFELAVATVAKAGINGLWVNQPTAAVDLSGVSWSN
ncbi:MAG: peptide/nickel transport system substrate-binding protein [Yoonia sp.]